MQVTEVTTGNVKIEVEGTVEEMNALYEALDTTASGRKPVAQRALIEEFRTSLGSVLGVVILKQDEPVE